MICNIYFRKGKNGKLQVSLSSTSLTYQLFKYGVIDSVPSVTNDGHFVDAHNIENIDTSLYNLLFLN